MPVLPSCQFTDVSVADHFIARRAETILTNRLPDSSYFKIREVRENTRGTVRGEDDACAILDLGSRLRPSKPPVGQGAGEVLGSRASDGVRGGPTRSASREKEDVVVRGEVEVGFAGGHAGFHAAGLVGFGLEEGAGFVGGDVEDLDRPGVRRGAVAGELRCVGEREAEPGNGFAVAGEDGGGVVAGGGRGEGEGFGFEVVEGEEVVGAAVRDVGEEFAVGGECETGGGAAVEEEGGG